MASVLQQHTGYAETLYNTGEISNAVAANYQTTDCQAKCSEHARLYMAAASVLCNPVSHHTTSLVPRLSPCTMFHHCVGGQPGNKATVPPIRIMDDDWPAIEATYWIWYCPCCSPVSGAVQQCHKHCPRTASWRTHVEKQPDHLSWSWPPLPLRNAWTREETNTKGIRGHSNTTAFQISSLS